MTYANDIINVATHLNTNNNQTNLTTDSTTRVDLPNIPHDIQDIRWIELDSMTNKNIIDLSEIVEKTRNK